MYGASDTMLSAFQTFHSATHSMVIRVNGHTDTEVLRVWAESLGSNPSSPANKLDELVLLKFSFKIVKI